MTAAVIALSVLALLLGGGLIAAYVMLRSSLASERASMTVEGIASRAQFAAERERDLALAAKTQAELERDRAQSALVDFQALVKQQAEELSKHVEQQVLDGSAADAVDVLRDLVSRKLPVADRPADSGNATGHDSGHAEPGAVRAP